MLRTSCIHRRMPIDLRSAQTATPSQHLDSKLYVAAGSTQPRARPAYLTLHHTAFASATTSYCRRLSNFHNKIMKPFFLRTRLSPRPFPLRSPAFSKCTPCAAEPCECLILTPEWTRVDYCVECEAGMRISTRLGARGGTLLPRSSTGLAPRRMDGSTYLLVRVVLLSSEEQNVRLGCCIERRISASCHVAG